MAALFGQGLIAKAMARDKQRAEPPPASEPIAEPSGEVRKKRRMRIGAGAIGFAARDLLARR